MTTREARKAYPDIKARQWYRTHYNHGGMVRVTGFEMIAGKLWCRIAGSMVIAADMIDTTRDVYSATD